MLAIFAHGSLMFRSELPARTRPATVRGLERRFGQPSVRNWGRRPAPAPTSSLVPGDRVDGLLLELADPDGTHLASLTRRENGEPIEIRTETPEGIRSALTWPMASDWADLDVEGLVEAAVRNVAHGGGPFGDAWEYVDGMVSAMDAHGIDDPLVRAYHTSLRRAIADGR